MSSVKLLYVLIWLDFFTHLYSYLPPVLSFFQTNSFPVKSTSDLVLILNNQFPCPSLVKFISVVVHVKVFHPFVHQSNSFFRSDSTTSYFTFPIYRILLRPLPSWHGKGFSRPSGLLTSPSWKFSTITYRNHHSPLFYLALPITVPLLNILNDYLNHIPFFSSLKSS